jgi:hypothetical protein
MVSADDVLGEKQRVVARVGGF